MNDIISIVISYILVIGIGFFLLNFLSNGFLFTFIRVKGSRGKLVLVELHELSNNVFKAGKFDGNLLTWKVSRKKSNSILVDKSAVTRKIGVVCIVVDGINNVALTPDLEGIEPFDAGRYDDLLVTAQGLPKISGNKDNMINLILLIVIAVILLFVTYRINILDTGIKALQSTGGVIG